MHKKQLLEKIYNYNWTNVKLEKIILETSAHKENSQSSNILHIVWKTFSYAHNIFLGAKAPQQTYNQHTNNNTIAYTFPDTNCNGLSVAFFPRTKKIHKTTWAIERSLVVWLKTPIVPKIVWWVTEIDQEELNKLENNQEINKKNSITTNIIEQTLVVETQEELWRTLNQQELDDIVITWFVYDASWRVALIATLDTDKTEEEFEAMFKLRIDTHEFQDLCFVVGEDIRKIFDESAMYWYSKVPNIVGV